MNAVSTLHHLTKGWTKLLLLFVVIGSTGCARTPEVEYFTLTPLFSDSTAPSADIGAVLVEVTTPALPTYIKRDEIVEHLDERSLKIHEHKRWVADLDKVIRDYLLSSLQHRMSSMSFVSGASKMSDRAAYRLDWFFNRLDIYHQDRIEVGITWQITNARGELINGPNRMVNRQSLQGESVDFIVATLNLILEQLSNEISVQFDTLMPRDK